MASTKSIVFISGKLSWAKVLGDPVPNYNKDGREWTFELEPNEAGIQTLLKHGLADRIKGKGYVIGMRGQHADRTPFIQLKKSELNREGEKNTPIRIYDADDNVWDQNTLIGNGSAADVKLDIRDYGPGKKSGIYPVAIRVTDHVEYTASEFGGMEDKGEDDFKPAKGKGKKKDTFKEDFGLDDDIPF